MPPQLPQHVKENHIICVGAVYIDTILTVPHFPQEDSKLRAKKITRRRGGNTANTLEVLAQLVQLDPFPSSGHKWTPEEPGTWLHLHSVLPSHSSNATRFIKDSLPGINLEKSIFRQDHEEAASSYIIQSQATLSRTIVSVNALPEMTTDEFKAHIGAIAKDHIHQRPQNNYWIHFEGRIPDVTLNCVQYLRSEHSLFKISVECEKPEREDMAEVAKLADVVFYSKLWAEKNGFGDAKTFLEAQIERTRDMALLCCTWGAAGATAVQRNKAGGHQWADVGVWKPFEGNGSDVVVDTIGAGDSFIAGMLFAVNNHDEWSLQCKLEFANRLAGRKVLQEGFANLGRTMW
ncbi:hypothetical protein J1614_007250, partial [Plenodomus biglobosus]